MSNLTGDLGVLRILAEKYGLDDVVKKIEEGTISEKDQTTRLCDGCTVACSSSDVI